MRRLINVTRFVLDNLTKLHNGVGVDKILAAVKIAAVPAIFLTIFEGLSKWYIVNQMFMVFVFCAIAVDHILGSIVHAFYKRDFQFRKNITGLLVKLGGCISGYMMFTMMHEIVKDVDFIAIYFKILLQLIVFIYPAGSAMGNLSVITGGKFPPIGWMRKLSRFQENLDLNEFKTKKDESNTNDIDDTPSSGL